MHRVLSSIQKLQVPILHLNDVAIFNCMPCDLIAHLTFQTRKRVGDNKFKLYHQTFSTRAGHETRVCGYKKWHKSDLLLCSHSLKWTWKWLWGEPKQVAHMVLIHVVAHTWSIMSIISKCLNFEPWFLWAGAQKCSNSQKWYIIDIHASVKSTMQL